MSTEPPAGKILCYVTDRSVWPAGEDALGCVYAKIAIAAAAGVDWIQIREKDLAAGELAKLARTALQACSRTPAKIFINDRMDVALAEGAAGVHLGENSISAGEVRTLLRCTSHAAAGFLTGVSCHSVGSAQRAADSGADYVIFGPVFPTPSKAKYGPEQGLQMLAEVCRAVRIPVLAIGGVNLENAAACADAGAAGIAAIRLFQEAAELPAVIARLRSLH
ncbi:MAG TPA: thiamine phosphate synthase [Candidatus Acidoferrum sp.]|nr:thiamine phosphate synthase [Candidatus Acidoferrum sp.]